MIKLRKFRKSDYDCFGGVESDCPLISYDAKVSGLGWIDDAIFIVDDLNISIYTGPEAEYVIYKDYSSVGDLLFDLVRLTKLEIMNEEDDLFGFKCEVI